MSTNPSPDYNQPQYFTLSPEWSALLKIGRAYRLLFQFNLIWILLAAAFFVVMTALVVTNYNDLEKSFNESRSTIEEKIHAQFKKEESRLEPEAAIEFLSAELADPAEEFDSGIPDDQDFSYEEIVGEEVLKFLGTVTGMVLGLFFLVFMIMALICFVIQIIVLIRFANCPSSIIPGGHGVGLAYAICMGLALFLGITLGGAAGPLNLASLVLFLVFSGKVAAAVQSESGRRWLTILIVAICCSFIVLVIAGFVMVAAVFEDSDLIVVGILTVVSLLILVSFMVWFSFLKLYQHLGRDVPRFIEAAMAHYSGRMNQQF
ncbi:MAG: hypothetical protein K6C40_11760 [Thermoguttaceae bacterium]|nr:hypothetical protein [Thermoguttaceae bacterium]